MLFTKENIENYLTKTRVQIIIGLFFLITTLLHFPVFQLELISTHAWRQTETETVIRNFVHEDFNILNPRINNRGAGDGIMRKEFPIMQWLFAGVYKTLDVEDIAVSRILSFCLSLITILGIFCLVKLLTQSKVAALVSAWCLLFSPSLFYFSICPMPDNFALGCCIWGMYWWFMYEKTAQFYQGLFSLFLFSLSALSKLPFILIFSLPFFHFITALLKSEYSRKQVVMTITFVGALIPVFAWYLAVIGTWKGNGIVTGIIDNKYSLSELLRIARVNAFEIIPIRIVNLAASVFLIAGFWRGIKERKFNTAGGRNLLFIFLLLSIYIVFELNMIYVHHEYYFFPFIPLLFILVGYGSLYLVFNRLKWVRMTTFLLLALVPMICMFEVSNRWKESEPGFNKDLYIHRVELQKAVPDAALCVVGNDPSTFIFFYYLQKKGWAFQSDWITTANLKSMIDQGAEYLYTDSEMIISNPEFQKFRHLIMVKGSIHVFKLSLPK